MTKKIFRLKSKNIVNLTEEELDVMLYSYLAYEWSGDDSDYLLDQLDNIDRKLNITNKDYKSFGSKRSVFRMKSLSKWKTFIETKYGKLNWEDKRGFINSNLFITMYDLMKEFLEFKRGLKK